MYFTLSLKPCEFFSFLTETQEVEDSQVNSLSSEDPTNRYVY